jgi:hypothetical protein
MRGLIPRVENNRPCLGENLADTGGGKNSLTKDLAAQPMPPSAGNGVAAFGHKLAPSTPASGHSTLGDLSGPKPPNVHDGCAARTGVL